MLQNIVFDQLICSTVGGNIGAVILFPECTQFLVHN